MTQDRRLLSRRFVLAGGIASLTTPVLAKPDVKLHDLGKTESIPAQTTLNRFLAADHNQFVLIHDEGGTYHGDNDGGSPVNAMTFLADPKTMQVLAQNGYQFLATELRKEFQPLADQLASGAIDAKQYQILKAKMYEAVGDEPGSHPSPRALLEAAVIQQAAKHGIKVLCVENQAPNLKAHGELVDKLADGDNADASLEPHHVKATTPLRREREIREIVNYQLRASQSARSVEKISKDIEEMRLGHDSDLAKSIIRQVGTTKTAVFYGSGHGDYPCTLNSFLGHAKRIEVFGDESWLRSVMQGRYMENAAFADLAIALDNGRSYSPKEIQNFILSASRKPQSLTPQLCKNPKNPSL